MKKLNKILILFISLTFLLTIPTPANAINDRDENIRCLEEKRILILESNAPTSYHTSLKRGVTYYFEELFPNSIVNFEVISSYSSYDPSELSHLFQSIDSGHRTYDLIVCLDKYSVEFVNKIHTLYPNDTPVLFGYDEDIAPELPKSFVGYYMPYNFERFMNTILSLHPSTEEVNLIVNKSFEKSYIWSKIDEYIENSKLNIKFNTIISNFDTKNLEACDDENALNILFTPIFSEISDGYFSPYPGFGSEKYIASLTKNPTYGGFSDFISVYNVGGYNYDGYGLGRQLAYDGVDLLSGNLTTSELGIREYSPKNYLKFFTQLQSYYGIPSEMDGAIYVNKSIGNTSIQKKQASIVKSVMIILSFIVCFLLVLNFYTKKLYKERLKIDEIKNNFIANVSHELRTPLNIIISCIQLLEVKKNQGDIVSKSNDFDQKFIYLKKNSSRLLRLVNNIIDITKMDSGFFNIDKSYNDIVNVVEEITLSSVPYAESKEISLIFDTNIEELYFSFDKERIERVILNLLSNSLKFTPEKGEINVFLSGLETEINITIQDNGIGIPENKLTSIFDRFVQAEDTPYRKSEGSGIGLSICKTLVELHQGTITVESTIDKGSIFTVNLPIVTDNTKLQSNKISDGLSKQVTLEYSDFNNYI